MENIIDFEPNCNTYRTCAQCKTNEPACNWSVEKQVCVKSNPAANTSVVVSCPRFKVSLIYDSIKVSILDKVKSFDNFIKKSNTIHCQLEDKHLNITHVSSNHTEFVCIHDRKLYQNYRWPIKYWSLVVNNNTSLKFNNPEDHYITSFDRDCHNITCATGYWETESYAYYCKWCLKKQNCTLTENNHMWPCHVRKLQKNTAHDKHLSSIAIQSPNFKIVSFDPLVGLSTGPVTINIVVKNNLYLSEDRSMKITVAGRPCIMDQSTSRHDETISCIIPAIDGPIYKEKGPVEITYSSASQNYHLKSTKIFSFVTPLVDASSSQNCGPMVGGVLLDIKGKYLNVTNDVQVLIDENITCTVVKLNSEQLSCVVGSSDVLMIANVQLFFNGRILDATNSNLSFKYMANPTIDEEQRFESIASGGVQLMVHGNFSCLKTWAMYVAYDGKLNVSFCRYKDNRVLICKTPYIDIPESFTSMELKHGFLGITDEKIVNLTSTNTSYTVFPNPVFTNFEVNENSLLIHGEFLNKGYRKKDLAVRIQGWSESLMVCNLVQENIECWIPEAIDVQTIVVNVGYYKEQILKLKFNPGRFILLTMTELLQGIIILGGVVIFIYVLLFIIRSMNSANSIELTEKSKIYYIY
ncbi:plexin-A4-like isoform X2 [Sipha flava]|nr:plexin-A4-like isoform X2 [Sipha flava]